MEEGLKLYQAALKLHSQGPASYPQAAAAYTALFSSEIFKYPESETEFRRIDNNPEFEYTDAYPLGLDIGTGGVDAQALPQILYLAYKNHGQFILDCVKSRLRLEPMEKPALDYQVQAAVDNFALALASDESDTELWRRAARIGSTLGSRRIARYCLEAAVEVDDDPTVAELDPAGLEEGFAGEQLKEQLEVLGDETALSHPIMAPFEKKTMPEFLLKHMDPYPFLPDNTKSFLNDRQGEDRADVRQPRISVTVEERTWKAVGSMLCQAFLDAHSHGSNGPNSSPGLVIILPPAEQGIEPVKIANAAEDQVMNDVPISESPAPESEAALATPVTGKSDDQPIEIVTTTTTIPLADDQGQSSVSLPTRKRSQSAAGIRSTPEEDSSTQKRSKRIRNRDNTTEGTTDPATQFAEQLKSFQKADDDTFQFVGGLLQKLGVDDLGSLAELQTAISLEEKIDAAETMTNTVVRDLRDILRNWDDAKASEFINGNAAEILGSSVNSANAGLAAFLEHSKSGPQKLTDIPVLGEDEGLAEFVEKVNSSWMPLQDIVWEFVASLLSVYRSKLWPEQLKFVLVRLITFLDSTVFSRIQFEMEHAQSPQEIRTLEEMVETLFELHIDIYTRITNPNSVVPYDTRLTTKERLDRWADLAADVVQSRYEKTKDDLALRYLWGSVFYATMADGVSREHKVLCWSDLQSLLQESGKPVIELQNNAVMLEISAEAAEREVSKLTTMDFFFNLFQTDRSDPLAIIETLEPVLDPESACAVPEAEPSNGAEAGEAIDSTPAALREMWKFLQTGSTSLRLFLWQRLNEAYASIGYSTKVLSCNLKSIEVIVAALRTAEYADLSPNHRYSRLLTWFKALDDLLVKSLTLALNDAASCFEIIDDRHIKSTCSALAQLTRILHTASIFDDEVRVGMRQLPTTPAYGPNGNFSNFTNKLREMQVRTWALQYTLIKEAMTQNQELFLTPDNDLADYLALVHYALGMRKSCKASNKIFLKMMKVEMIRFKNIERWEDYLGQVLFDLFGLRLGVGVFELEDHGCPTEQLDRRTVLNIADQVIILANRMPTKDLLKHELRPTIEKMQTAVGLAKHTPHMSHNLRNYTEYLKTSLRPLDMYRAWKGQVLVDSIPVSTPETPLADKGWYFLLGMINLTKFRSQKRLGPGAQTDDLRVGVSFLRLQLQFTAEHWETWYRLAQCFDFELEEEVLWSADKINNHRPELTKIQRSAIHCYVMALSTAVRNADDSFATAEKLSEMYYDFGMRMYSSSREPFGMEAFWTDEFEKHMSGSTGMYKKPLHEELSRYRAWKYAAKLFRESLRDRPNNWMAHFMLGKCLWKMYCKADEEWDEKLRATRPSMDAVLRAFVNAIRHVPKPRDSRQEPVLEPHYKLVSIVHKLVAMRAMEPQAGADLLQQQPFAIRKGAQITIDDHEEWEPFVLESLRHLRNADKQHWHHRMIARAANIIYDDNHPDYVQAQAAKHEFRESIFTKTMHVMVWKPDAERPGRHCVYMERYVHYMIKLLVLTNDKASIEALVKRLRKKGNDFYRFEKVWTAACTEYMKMIRRSSNITPNMEDVFKNVSHDEFESLCDRLTVWTADPTVQHPALDALRESSELKKLNAGLMKSTPIDDLINDAWAVLYTQVGKTLPGPDPASLHAAQTDGPSASPGAAAVRAMGPMSLNNLVMDMNGTQISVPVTVAGSESSRPRKTGISRRDTLKRAELAASRIPDIPRAIAPAPSRSRVSEPLASMVLGSNTEQEQKQRSASASTPQVEAPSSVQQEQDQDQEQEDEQDAEQEERQNDQESERGSVHDSADDESDLSDVPDMDDVETAAIFPTMVEGDDDGSSDGEEGSESAE